MLTNEKERRVCAKYSKRDETGKVRCSVCPLSKSEGGYDMRCKANSHYNRHTREWEYDDTPLLEIENKAFLRKERTPKK